MKLGERLPNGSWDGVIGSAIEGRGDIVMQIINPNIFDSAYDIPGQIGPVTNDGSLSILSASTEVLKEHTTLLGFFSDAVEAEFYFYCLVWTLVFLVTHTAIVLAVWKRGGPKQPRVSIEADYEGENISHLKAALLTIVNCFWMITEIFVLTETTASETKD